MKRRNFIKGLIFAALAPVAQAVCVPEIIIPKLVIRVVRISLPKTLCWRELNSGIPILTGRYKTRIEYE